VGFHAAHYNQKTPGTATACAEVPAPDSSGCEVEGIPTGPELLAVGKGHTHRQETKLDPDAGIKQPLSRSKRRDGISDIPAVQEGAECD
jgi:hypothetical protein